MARKTLKDAMKSLTEQLDNKAGLLEYVRNEVAFLSHELNLIKTFDGLKAGDYIDSTAGKGTVLNKLKDNPHGTVRVFVGKDDTANIVAIRYWEFKGKL